MVSENRMVYRSNWKNVSIFFLKSFTQTLRMKFLICMLGAELNHLFYPNT